MGQAFDKTGAFLGEAEADSAREVLDKLQLKHKDATEFRIRTAEAGSVAQQVEEKYRAGLKDIPQQRPSIGRIVLYNHPGSLDGKYPPTQSPAIIQNVAADGTVRLFVFGPKGQHMDDGLSQGDGPCQWNWPPRV